MNWVRKLDVLNLKKTYAFFNVDSNSPIKNVVQDSHSKNYKISRVFIVHLSLPIRSSCLILKFGQVKMYKIK